MSETMNIRFGPDMPMTAIEVITADLETIHMEVLEGGDQIDVKVPSADAFIRLRLPSGKMVTLRHSGDLKYRVDLNSILSRSASVQRERSMVRNIADLRSYNQDRSRDFRGTSSFRLRGLDVNAGRPEPTADLPELPGGFKVKWLPEVAGEVSDDGAEFRFDPYRSDAPYELVIKGRRNFRIRVPGHVQTAYVRSDAVGSDNIILSVRIATASTYVDTVGGYLMRSDYYSAKMMEGWAQRAENMLQMKMSDPYAATVAAYLLLRLERYDLLHDWPRNLANWFSEIPDGCFIWAAKCALASRDRAEAQQYIEMGLNRGLPVYTEGLHLLSQILRRLGDDGRKQLEQLGQNTQGVIWSSPFTALSSGWSDDALPVSLNVAYATAL